MVESGLYSVKIYFRRWPINLIKDIGVGGQLGYFVPARICFSSLVL